MTPKHRFVILAQDFFASYNPMPDNMIIALDCLLGIPDDLIPDEPTMRYRAHAFTRLATLMLLNTGATPSVEFNLGQPLHHWTVAWFKAHSPYEYHD